MLDRLKSWKSSGAGVGAAAVVMYLFTSLGCKAPDSWQMWAAGVITALPGLLGKDK